MIKIAIGLVLGFVVGVLCRYAGLPLPAPMALPGAMLVLAMTSGFILTGQIAKNRPNLTKPFCGGPTGKPPSAERKETTA